MGYLSHFTVKYCRLWSKNL